MDSITKGNHTLRRAVPEDIPFIMDFLDVYWEKGCLLSRDRAYFEWEFVVDDDVNYFIAIHNTTGEIDAAIGFIPCSKRKIPDGFTAIWAANPRSSTKFIGLLLSENWRNLRSVRNTASVSMRLGTSVAIAQRLYGIEAQRMNHYYRLAERDCYRIAVVSSINRIPISESCTKLIPLPTMEAMRRLFDFDKVFESPLYKDQWYFEHRYFRHPYYRFSVWGVETSPGHIEGLLVGRTVETAEAAVLRIIDFCGPNSALCGIGPEIDLLMKSGGLEYTDFYCLGIPEDIMLKAGFALRNDDDANIIPNHFEPFEQCNVDIWARIPRVKNVRLFKGDGDQGRPKSLRMPSEWIPEQRCSNGS